MSSNNFYDGRFVAKAVRLLKSELGIQLHLSNGDNDDLMEAIIVDSGLNYTEVDDADFVSEDMLYLTLQDQLWYDQDAHQGLAAKQLLTQSIPELHEKVLGAEESPGAIFRDVFTTDQLLGKNYFGSNLHPADRCDMLTAAHTEESRTFSNLAKRGSPVTAASLRDEDHGFRRLMRRAGIMFECPSCYEEIDGVAKLFVKSLSHQIKTRMRLLERSQGLIISDIVLSSLKYKYYGYGTKSGVRFQFTEFLDKVQKQVHPYHSLNKWSASVLNDMAVDNICRLLESAASGLASCSKTACIRYKGVTDGASFGDTESSGKVLYYEECADESAGEVLNHNMITEDHIKFAISSIFPDELAKHALSEACKAIASPRSNFGLEFDFRKVATVANRVQSFPFTKEAAIALAACTEYMAAEVLELSGNASRDNKSPIIEPRHIMLAVRNDDELDTVYTKACFRDSGLLKHIHSAFLNLTDDLSEEQEERLRSIRTKLEISSSKAFIEPRTGKYYSLPGDEEDDEIDDLSYLYSLTSHHSLKKMDHFEEDQRREAVMFGLLDENDREFFRNLEKSPTQLRKLREIEVREEQESIARCLDPLDLYAVIMQESDLSQFTLSHEAFCLLHEALEDHVISVLQDAMHCALHSHRKFLEPKDIQCARRLRGDRK